MNALCPITTGLAKTFTDFEMIAIKGIHRGGKKKRKRKAELI